MNKILLIDDFYFLINKTIVSVALYLLVLKLFGNQNFVSLYAITLIVFFEITYTIYLKLKYQSQINYSDTVSSSCTQLNFFSARTKNQKISNTL